MHPDVAVVSGVPPLACPLTVLHVAQPVTGGVAEYVRRAAEHQAGSWSVHVASPEPIAGPAVNAHAWHASRNPAAGVRREARELGRIVARVEPDVVVLHSAKAGLVGRLLVRGRVPTVYVPHAWSWLALPSALAAPAIAWERAAATWTNALVAVGEGEARAGMAAGVRAPLHVVPSSVAERWSEIPPERAGEFRRDLGNPSGPVVVTVGRLARQKGQDVLLHAWRRVVRERPDALLVLVGDGPAEAELRAAAPPGVVFAGSADPLPFLAAADVVALPSRWEGLSLALLEAMAVGRSVVTTEVAGSEVVRAAGCGAVVPIESVGPLADAILERLGGALDAAAEGARGAAYIRERHDPAVALERLAAVIVRARAFGPG